MGVSEEGLVGTRGGMEALQCGRLSMCGGCRTGSTGRLSPRNADSVVPGAVGTSCLNRRCPGKWGSETPCARRSVAVG